MQKIKYSFLDIKNNKNNSIIFLIQMIIVLLLVNFSISQITSISDGLNRILVLRNSNSYMVIDNTANEKVDEILNNPESSLPKLKSMYEKMRNANCENQYTFFGYQMGMNADGIILEQKNS